MRGNVIETVMGAVVLVVAAVFLFFAYSTSQSRSGSGYVVTAEFQRIDGIKEGSDVRISGIKVGSVVGQSLDPKTFLATLRRRSTRRLNCPDDSSAGVVPDSCLAASISLTPADREGIRSVGAFTQSSVGLEHLIGQMMFTPPAKKPARAGTERPPRPAASAQGAAPK